MNEWHDLFLGEVGASAALAGLLFVAISINLSEIIRYPGLPGRAAEALVLLGGVLVVSSVELVPQPALALGVEVALVGLFLWLCIAVIQVRAARNPEARYQTSNFVFRVLTGQASALPVLAGGIATGPTPPGRRPTISVASAARA